MSLFDKVFKLLGDPGELPGSKPKTLPEDHSLHKETFKVIGMTYHPESFARIRIANPNWRTSKKKILGSDLVRTVIPHYTYPDRPVELKIDPTNEHGKGRVMVFVAGEHIGYLPEDDSVHVGEILRFCSIKYILAEISGGEYRIVYADGTENKNTNPLKVSVFVGYSVK